MSLAWHTGKKALASGYEAYRQPSDADVSVFEPAAAGEQFHLLSRLVSACLGFLAKRQMEQLGVKAARLLPLS